MSYYTQILLQLKDTHITFLDKVDEIYLKDTQKALLFYGKLTYSPNECPCCHMTNHNHSIVKNGTRSSRLSLVPISGLKACLNLSKQRFYCRNCCSSFTDQSPVVNQHSFISNRLKQWVISQLDTTLSTKMISRYSNMSVHSVRRIVKDVARQIVPNVSSELPQHLCFDEFKGVTDRDKKNEFYLL
ncbi:MULTISPECIES: transposase family protein [unclassified Granulicatella]|uniref:transposase family protein n=1 Tax=unclassified Granulicatella TaxID=2630493 RepID=UPI00107498CD|nr:MULTISPECIES: transposase family protein [unclassified Granulicatella]MBF0781191.1 transposase [Granulicatella sp. 19428wC4_WM01]TFU91521.1 transposase [Granulicatella sp. WM01]